ncbi:MAG: hypothetical protein K5751_03885 [Treponemataceae bacterium]|nr:hypothetical protein [Treponemataceae bacterium]
MSYFENENRKADKLDWLTKWRIEHEDELDDLGFDFTPSKECPVNERDSSVVSSLSGIIQLDENYDYKSDYTSYLEQKTE